MRLTFVALLVVFGGALGCNNEATDDTMVEPTRDQRIDSMANEACARYEACNGYGADKKFASAATCKQEYKTHAAEAWPVAKCSDGKIDNSSYLICVESIKQVACTGDIWDGIVAAGNCTAAKVCTDAPA